MPRFLITLLALQAITSIALGDSRAKNFYKTGAEVVITRAYKNGDDSSVYREFMKLGWVLPPHRNSAVIEYNVVINTYTLPGGDLTRHDSCVFPVFIGLTDTNAEDKINDAMLHDACALWQVQYYLDIPEALEIAKRNDYYCSGYAVTNWDSTLLSVQLDSYYEGAYPNDLPLYFNFNTATGNLLTLDSVIAPGQMPRFQKMLHGKVKHILKGYRSDLSRELRKSEIDSESYRYCMDATRNGAGSSDPRAFTVSPDTMKVVLDWGFMHAMEALEPESEIAFTKKELKGVLKKEYE